MLSKIGMFFVIWFLLLFASSSNNIPAALCYRFIIIRWTPGLGYANIVRIRTAICFADILEYRTTQ